MKNFCFLEVQLVSVTSKHWVAVFIPWNLAASWGDVRAAASLWMCRALHRGCSASLTGFGDLHGVGTEAEINSWDWISSGVMALSCSQLSPAESRSLCRKGAPWIWQLLENVPGMCGSAGALSQGSLPLSARCLLHSPKLKVLAVLRFKHE